MFTVCSPFNMKQSNWVDFPSLLYCVGLEAVMWPCSFWMLLNCNYVVCVASKSLLDATHTQTHAPCPPSQSSWSVQMVWNSSKYLTSLVTLGLSSCLSLKWFKKRQGTFQRCECRILQCDIVWRMEISHDEASSGGDTNPQMRGWTSVVFRHDTLVGRLHLAFTICYIPQSHVASACSLCLILLPPPVHFFPLFFLFLISPLECDLWWPWPALFGILHTWRDLNRAQGPFHKGHSSPLG